MKLELISVGSCHPLEAMVVQRGRWRTISQPFLVGLLHHPRHGRWLIDTGLHPRLWRSSPAWVGLFLRCARTRLPLHQTLQEQLRWRRFIPDGIFLTHLHLDHVGGLLDFPGLPIITSRQGYQRFRQARGWRGLPLGWDHTLLPPDFEQRARWIEDQPSRPLDGWSHPGYDLFGDNSAIAVSLPGHAPGLHGLWLESACPPGSQRPRAVFLTADACGLSRMIEEPVLPRLPRLIAYDWEAEQQTLELLRQLRVRRPDLLLLPSHCPQAWTHWQSPSPQGPHALGP